jgi:hypothetical protein
MITVLWYVMLCHWVCISQRFEGISILQNVRNCKTSDTVIPEVVTLRQHHCENLRSCMVIITFHPLLYPVLAYINIESSPQHMELEGGGGCGGVDPCIFPSLHITTYCDTEWSEALRSAVTQTRNEVGSMFPTWSAHKEVFVMYRWHLEQRCPGGTKGHRYYCGLVYVLHVSVTSQ